MQIPRTSSGFLYDVLEVEHDAETGLIREQYKKLALQYHPDRTGGQTTEKFKEVEEAHRILSDPQMRQLYDLMGREGVKRFGSTPLAEMLLGNSHLIRPFFWLLSVLSLLTMIGLLLLFHRYDMQYLAKNNMGFNTIELWSWWYVVIPFTPLIALLVVGGVVFAKQMMRESGWKGALGTLPFIALPLEVTIVVLCLEETIEAPFRCILLALFCCFLLFVEWKNMSESGEHDLVDDPEVLRYKIKCLAVITSLILLFLSLIFYWESFWLIFLPLIFNAIWDLKFNVKRGVVTLYLLCMWAQKLSVETSITYGFDPKAIIASLPIFLASVLLLILSVMLAVASSMQSFH